MTECVCFNKNGKKCKRMCDSGVCWQHKAPLLLNSKLLHKTSILGMQKIVQSGMLLDSGELIKQQIFTPGGEGNISRRACCNPLMYPNQDDIPSTCNEACATYFRLLPAWMRVDAPRKGHCLLQFSTQLLCEDSVKWFFNTMENNGFLISNREAYYGFDSSIPSRSILSSDISLSLIHI